MLQRFEAHLRRRSSRYVAAASLLYFALSGVTAHRRPLWYDELFTFHLAKQAQCADVLHALAAGADIHPPLDYLLRHYSMRLLGSGELPDRLPSILAFWLMCLALRHIVARRCGEVLGIVAFLAPLCTVAYEYSYEGRGYALMLAGSSMALAGWQGVEGSRRPMALAVMGLGLVTAVTVHYFGFFVLIPLTVGEVVRARSRRSIDLAVLLVAAGSTLSFLVNLPYLLVQAAQIGTFWSRGSVAGTIQTYAWLLSEATLVLPLFLVLAAAACIVDSGAEPERLVASTIPPHEWSAAAAVVFVPWACLLLSRSATVPFHQRYMLVTILGVVLAGAFVAHHILAGSARLRVALLTAVALVGTYEMVKAARESEDPAVGRPRQLAVERALPESILPVVQGTRTGFMEATRYATPALLPRMYYLTNREASLKWVGNDNGQWAMENIAPLVPGHVMDYGAFLGEHGRFLLVNPRLAKDWILPQLLEDGAQIVYRTVAGDNVVLEVRMPHAGLRSSP